MPLTISGRNYLAGLIASNPPTLFDNSNAYLGAGDSSTAFSSSQTDLQASTNKFRKGMVASYPSVTGNLITFRSLFGTSEANFAWNEWGVFNASSGGVMFTRKVESFGTKSSTQSWQFTANVTVGVNITTALPLDEVAGADVAYGLRKLRAAYGGSAIRVRRSSDDSETDIGFSGDNLDTAALLAHCGSGDGYVSVFYDQSGNSLNFSPSADSFEPKIVENGAVFTRNGRPVLKSFGTSQFENYFGGLLSLSKAASKVVIASVGGWAIEPYNPGGFSEGYMYREFTPGFEVRLGIKLTNAGTLFLEGRALDADTTSLIGSRTGSSSAYACYGCVFDYANAQGDLRQNSISLMDSNSFTSMTAGAVSNTDSGGVNMLSGGNYGFADFDMSEFIYYGGSGIDNTNLGIIEANQMAYYNLSSTISFIETWDQVFRLPLYDGHTLSTFQVAGDSSPGLYANDYTVDVNYDVTTSNADAVEDIKEPFAFDDRSSGTFVLTTFRVPNGFILPDVTPPITPNNPAITLNTTLRQALYTNATCRPVAGGDMWGYIANRRSTHGGSYIAGGALTAAKLNSTIDHALLINLWGEKYLSEDGTGFVFPAHVADTGYDDPMSFNYYGGNDTRIKMGSRFAIDPSETPVSLGLTTSEGAALLLCLQKYGAYVCDNTAEDVIAINATEDCVTALTSSPVKADLAILYENMQLVV